jgi:hypothetical protein
MAASTSDKPEVKIVVVQISRPSPTNPNGVSGEGRYIVADGHVTLTDRDGKPVRDKDGKICSQKLNEGDNPRVIAGRMTKNFRAVLRGDKKPGSVSGFSQPIYYPKSWDRSFV